MYLVCMICFIIFMVFWLFGGSYLYYRADPTKPYAVGHVLLPWLCVLILGLIVFGGVAAGPSPFK